MRIFGFRLRKIHKSIATRSVKFEFRCQSCGYTDPVIAQALSGTSRVYLDDVTALVRDGQITGDISDRDPELLALGVLGAVSSYCNAHRSGHTGVSTEDLAVFVGEWVVGALTA